MKKFIAKSALLTGLVAAALFLLSPVLTPKWVEGHADNGHTYLTTTTQGYLDLPKDSIDTVFIGSSQVLRDISPKTLTEDYGLSAYTRATTVQAPSVSYYYLEDLFKRQSPKLVLADFSALYTDYDPDYREPYVRYAFDWMPLNRDKLEAVSATIAKSQSQKLIDFVFPSLYYHGRWAELSPFDVTYLFAGDKKDPQRGAILLDDVKAQEFTPLKGGGASAAAYAEESLDWYQKFMDLCEEHGADFIMLRLPRVGWTEERHTADQALADKNGVPLLDFNLRSLYEEVGLNAQTDFYDPGHLNSAGAAKLTAWLGEYLQG